MEITMENEELNDDCEKELFYNDFVRVVNETVATKFRVYNQLTNFDNE